MKSPMTWVLCAALTIAAPVLAQQATLSPQDYLDIQQLVQSTRTRSTNAPTRDTTMPTCMSLTVLS